MENVNVRREASICSDEELTEEQRQAGTQAYNLMLMMLASKDTVDTPQPSFLPRVDKSRSNRVILLDGGRGSGKTWLLVNMLERLRRPYLDDSSQNAKAARKTLWENPDKRIVPVGLLDLHPLPPSTNLLFHIIGRFERVLEWLEGDGKAEREPVAWHLTASGELDSRKKWRSLLRAVAAGWDGNVNERSARLDLDAYTVELEETERQRLNVMETFVSFVDALAKDFSKRHSLSELPLFVLAVDDADMSIDRSVESLDTVRMLWHPRVSFLLTGHSALFLQTLDVYCLGQVRKPLIGHVLHAQEISAVAPHVRVRGLANDIYDKIVPPGHRCKLRPIPPTRRLDVLVPVVQDEKQQSNNLKTFFAQMHAEPSQAKKSPALDKYFEIEPQLCEALPDRIRGLTDLATLAALRGTREANKKPNTDVPHNPASQMVHAIWRNALNSSDLYLEKLEGVVSISELNCTVDVRLSNESNLEFVPNTSDVAHSVSKTSPQVTILQVDRFDSSLEPGQLLPRAVTAGLMLAATIGFDQRQSFLNTPPSDYTGYERLFASSVYAPKNVNSGIAFSWPLPAGYTLPFYAAFSYRWKKELRGMKLLSDERQELAPDKIDELARRFLCTVVQLLWAKSDKQLNLIEPDWQILAKYVSQLMAHGGTRSRRWALRRAGLLGAPEYGVSPASANAWLGALRSSLGDRQWQHVAKELQAERKAQPNTLTVFEMETALESIDAEFHEHNWARWINNKTPILLVSGHSESEPPTESAQGLTKKKRGRKADKENK